MRTRIFRTPPTLVDDTGVVVALKDMDGADPFDLFVENVDVAASLRTRFGSKNANVRFVAHPGAKGNDIRVAITSGKNQAFSVVVDPYDSVPYGGSPYYDPYGGLVTINLRCDEDGVPNQFVSDVVDLLNAGAEFAATLRASLALGSDGSARMEIPDPAGAPTVVMAETPLAGGFDATDLGAVTAEVSPTGAPEMAGPWVADASAATAFGSSVPKGTMKVWSSVDKPVRGLRVKATKGSSSTMVTVTAVVRKRGGI